MKLELNFLADWQGLLREKLVAARYDNVDELSDNDVELAYFNVLHRCPSTSPRRVHEAPSLTYPGSLRAGYDLVKQKIERGDDLRPHLSWYLKRLDFDDHLLNDWGIHHLHLGVAPDATRPAFVERTRELLYAHFTTTDAYLLLVGDHESFEDRQLVEVLMREFPDAAPYEKLVDVLPPDRRDEWTGSQRKGLRRAGCMLGVEVDGAAYVTRGGGCATSGIAVRACREAEQWSRIVQDLEAQVRLQASLFEEGLRRLGRDVPERVRIQLYWQDGAFVVATGDGGVGRRIETVAPPREP